MSCVLYSGRVWSVSVCLTCLSVNHCRLYYDFISHYRKDFCTYIKATCDYSNFDVYYLALSNAATSERALCFFAQSLPLSILLGRAQPIPSALCRQPTHHIQMALVAHTHSRLPLWRPSAIVQKTLCFYGSSIQVPQTCSCVNLMAVTLLFFFFFGFSLRCEH